MDNNMQNHNPKFKILTVSFLMLLGFFGLAKTSLAVTPAISNVSGTVATGQTLTITGTNMMDENMTNWDTFFTTHPTAYGFEGTSPGTAGQCDGDCYCDLGPCYGTYDSNVKLMGNKSIKFEVAGAHSENLGSYNAYMNISGNKWYRWYTRWYSNDNLWADSHIKHFYTGGSGAGGGVLWQPAEGTTLPSQFLIFEADGSTSNTYFNLPNGQIQNDKWYCFEVYINSTSSPYTMDVWVDGVQMVNGFVFPAQPAQDYLRFGIVNDCCNSNSAYDVTNWWDSMVDSTTRIYPASVIEVSNNSTYGQGSVKYQDPVYLSDGSVQVKVNLAGLGSGPYYLFVTNNRQETSAAYNLSGDGGDTVPPSAPSGLMVS